MENRQAQAESKFLRDLGPVLLHPQTRIHELIAESGWLFWTTLSAFGLSMVFGLLFIMHSIYRLHCEKTYSVYSIGLRFMSILQILLVFLGAVLFCFFILASGK